MGLSGDGGAADSLSAPGSEDSDCDAPSSADSAAFDSATAGPALARFRGRMPSTNDSMRASASSFVENPLE